MKRKDSYILRQVGGKYVIMPTGDKAFELSGIIKISDTGALLWETLAEDVSMQQLISALMSEYDVDEKTAADDINEFISQLTKADLIEK